MCRGLDKLYYHKHFAQITMIVHSPLELELAGCIVEALNLEETCPEDIDPEQPLFREGLGLDSIDALEISLAISTRYGFDIDGDDDENTQMFQSLRALSQHVHQHRTK